MNDGNKPTFDYSKLKGRIVEKYGSQTAFAEKLGISANMLSMCLLNKKRFTTKNIDKSVKLLDIPVNEVGVYFFSPDVR